MLLERVEVLTLQAALPARPETKIGLLLYDPERDQLEVKVREDAAAFAGEEDAEVMDLRAADLEGKAREMGGGRLLAYLEDALSNALRITRREPAMVRDFRRALERFFERRVLGIPAAPVPLPRRVPVYSLRAAAGRFGEDMEVEPDGWAEVPPEVRGSEDLYAARIAGRSMEPEVPDGALAVFRYRPGGSRQGKRVLVWRRAASAAGGEFTLKVYESEKAAEGGAWRHERIRLKPLNPEYPVLELEDEREYAVLGELITLLGDEDAL